MDDAAVQVGPVVDDQVEPGVQDGVGVGAQAGQLASVGEALFALSFVAVLVLELAVEAVPKIVKVVMKNTCR